MAYRMLIAEDELEEFEVVIYLLKKLNMDSLFQIYHARNGKQALVFLEDEETEIDLLLTDIEMPFANGLQVAAKAREKNAKLPIVFFSCYDDFSYVKTALSVQACNYMLKPIDPVEFSKTMQKTLEQLQRAEEEKISRKSRVAAVKNHYLYGKLNRMVCDESQLIQVGLTSDFAKQYTRLMMLHFEEPFFDCDAVTGEDVVTMLHHMFSIQFDYVNLNSSQSLLLFKEQGTVSVTGYEDICRRVRGRVEQTWHVRGYFAISSLLSGTYGLVEAYEDVGNLLETRFFHQERFVFYKETVQLSISDKQDACSLILAEIEGDTDAGNLDKLLFDVGRMNRIFEQNQNFSHIYVRYMYSQLVQILCRNQDLSEVQRDIEGIFSCSFIYEIEMIINRVLERWQREKQCAETGKKQIVMQIEHYIASNYQKQLTLNELAGIAYLNASYLSSLFKLETGIGINEYIKNIRMEKAKKMLIQTNQKVSSIAEAVGFTNYSYFIKSFHEYFGETPARIRQK